MRPRVSPRPEMAYFDRFLADFTAPAAPAWLPRKPVATSLRLEPRIAMRFLLAFRAMSHSPVRTKSARRRETENSPFNILSTYINPASGFLILYAQFYILTSICQDTINGQKLKGKKRKRMDKSPRFLAKW